MEDQVVDDCGRLAREGAPAGRHLIQNQAEGEDVGAGIHLFLTYLLRRHIAGGAQSSPRAGQGLAEPDGIGPFLGLAGTWVLPRGQLRHSKVQYLHRPLLGQEDVRGLDVAMDDALVVSRL